MDVITDHEGEVVGIAVSQARWDLRTSVFLGLGLCRQVAQVYTMVDRILSSPRQGEESAEEEKSKEDRST